jgi:hypothetical protein
LKELAVEARSKRPGGTQFGAGLVGARAPEVAVPVATARDREGCQFPRGTCRGIGAQEWQAHLTVHGARRSAALEVEDARRGGLIPVAGRLNASDDVDLAGRQFERGAARKRARLVLAPVVLPDRVRKDCLQHVVARGDARGERIERRRRRGRAQRRGTRDRIGGVVHVSLTVVARARHRCFELPARAEVGTRSEKHPREVGVAHERFRAVLQSEPARDANVGAERVVGIGRRHEHVSQLQAALLGPQPVVDEARLAEDRPCVRDAPLGCGVQGEIFGAVDQRQAVAAGQRVAQTRLPGGRREARDGERGAGGALRNRREGRAETRQVGAGRAADGAGRTGAGPYINAAESPVVAVLEEVPLAHRQRPGLVERPEQQE